MRGQTGRPSPERYQRIRDNDRHNLLKLLEKQKKELGIKITNLQNSGLLANSSVLRNKLLDLQNQFFVLGRKLNHGDE